MYRIHLEWAVFRVRTIIVPIICGTLCACGAPAPEAMDPDFETSSETEVEMGERPICSAGPGLGLQCSPRPPSPPIVECDAAGGAGGVGGANTEDEKCILR